ncbi:MAG: riboflavin synthase [Chloroflexi bacterium]|nr:MAG: riboflavin synthase [Chloroflexota bacterium]
MFSGIVSAVGRVAQTSPNRLDVKHAGTAARLTAGASVAVNGACLTVTKIDGDTFAMDVVPETLSRTNLGELKAGDKVNLELPLTLQQPLDGHLVLGHVDAVGEVLQGRDAESGRELTISLPADLARYVALKGSIAVDGVSLTVAAVQDGGFGVALIPHTLARTVAQNYRRGTRVNLEVDVLARYLENLQNR